MYVVVGETTGVKGRDIAGRSKNVYEELLDVWLTERPPAGDRYLVFLDCSRVKCSDYLHLVTFDLGPVLRRDGRPRRPTKEYSLIKDSMLMRLCGRIDNSVYVCAEDYSDLLSKRSKLGVKGVEVYRVLPANERTKREVAEAVALAQAYVLARAATVVARGRGVERIKAMLEVLRSIPETTLRKYERILGLRLSLQEAVKTLEAKLGRSARAEGSN